MYHRFFGLQKTPFSLTSDPRFLYLTAQHREALAALSYAILSCKGLVVLTGDAGTGKTTLLMQIMQSLPVTQVQSSMIVNPTLSPSEFLEATLMDFGMESIPDSKVQRIALLQGFLCKAHEAGQISALIIDEAHKLSLEVLEEIRLLGNLESGQEKLLQIVLVGQPELDGLLNSEQLRQFKQRVAMRTAIGPLLVEDIGPYIQYRWSVAGGAEASFSAEAVAGIADAARGIPRLVNVICDNALMEAFVDVSTGVEIRHVLAVCRDLQLEAPTPLPVIAPAQLPPPTPGPTVLEEFRMRTLERYSIGAARPSLWARMRNKFKPMQRMEVA